jgi:hypothetical protein
MGVIFTIVLGAPAQIPQMGLEGWVYRDFPTLPTKLLDEVTWEELFALLMNMPYTNGLGFEAAVYEEAQVLWIQQLSALFTQRLAELSPAERTQYVLLWFQTQAVQMYRQHFFRPRQQDSGWLTLKRFFAAQAPSPDQAETEALTDITAIFNDLCDLAQWAIQSQQRLFLRTTLFGWDVQDLNTAIAG